LCLFDAVELDESKLFGDHPIKRSYVAGTDEIVTACSYRCGPSFFGKRFVNLRIGYFLNGGQSQTPVLEIIADPTGLYRIVGLILVCRI
jgi:hypothetical protein